MTFSRTFEFGRWKSPACALGAAATVLAFAANAFAQAPQIDATIPYDGSATAGVSQTIIFEDSYAVSAHPELDVSMFNSYGSTGCYFSFQWNGGSPILWVYNNTGTSYTTVRFGTSDTASNSYCQVSGQTSWYSFSYGYLYLNVSLTFPSAMAGQTFHYYERATDNATGATTGWWQIPGAYLSVTAASLGPPQLGTVIPANSSSPPNQPVTLQFTAIDPNGWTNNNEVEILISSNHTQTNACYIAFFPWYGQMYLLSDDLSTWNPVAFGSGSASNSQCSLTGSGSALSYSGTTLTMTLNLEFFPSFVGANFVDEYAVDQWSSAGWGTIGTFTVGGPPIITTTSPLSFGVVTYQYSTQFQVQGYKSPYTWSVQPGGSLPPGLSLSAAGVLGGTPSQSGNFSFNVGVTDGLGNSATPLSSYVQVLDVSAMVTPSPQPTQQPLTMTGTKVGVFRNSVSFLEDSNGDGIAVAPPDLYIPSFTGPGGFMAGDISVVGDWTGDGHAKVGIYRQSTGTWYLDANNDGVYNAGDYTYQFGGLPGDMPFVGNWNGVKGVIGGIVVGYMDCIGIYRSPASTWLLDLNCNGTFDNTPTDAFFPFGGLQGDVPVVGAWSGGTTRAGVVRCYAPSGLCTTPPFYWVIDGNDANAGNLPTNHQPAAYCFAFGGVPNDVFVTGDWYNTGTTGAGVFRQNFYWVLDAALPGAPLQSSHVTGLAFPYGNETTDLPVTGKWAPGVIPSLMVTQAAPPPFPCGDGQVCPTSSTIVCPAPGSCPFTVQTGQGSGTHNVTFASSNGVSIQGGLVTGGSPGTTFNAVVAAGATPSAAGGPAPAEPYALALDVDGQQASGVAVYVAAPSAANIHVTPNIDLVDVYDYNGLADWYYNAKLSSQKYNFLFPGVADVSLQPTALRNAAAQWASQNVTGVALNIPLCNCEFGTGIIQGCGTATPTLDTTWPAKFGTFLQDLLDASNNRITNLGLRVSFANQGDQNRYTTPLPGVQLHCGADQSTQQLVYEDTSPFPLVTASASIYGTNNDGYWCLTNPGLGQSGNQFQPGPGGTPGNGNFLGWAIIFKALDLVFAEMAGKGINLQALDLSSESDIALGETVRMQMIFDPFHNVNAADLASLNLSVSGPPNYWSPGCQFQGSPDGTGGTDVLGWLRCLAYRYWSNPGAGAVAMSLNERTAYQENLPNVKPDPGVPVAASGASFDPGNGNCGTQSVQDNILGGQTWTSPYTYGNGTPFLRAATAAYGICCPSHYGDDSRADNGSMFANALLGRLFGDSGSPTIYWGDPGPWGVGRSLTAGLYCLLGQGDSAYHDPGPLTYLPVTYGYLPLVFDWHSYPKLFGCGDDPPNPHICTTPYNSNDPNWVALTPREALTGFDAFQDIINKYTQGASSGAILQIGETHSPISLTAPYGAIPIGYTCEDNPAANTWLSFLGLRESSAATAGAIVRPFAVDTLAGGFTSCYPFYPNPVVITNGYDKNQP